MKLLIAILGTLALGWMFTDLPIKGHAGAPAFADVQDQIHKTLTLGPGAEVRVSGFNGSVKVETSDSNQADINIQVRASSQEAMDRRPVIIDQSGNTLIIRTENEREGRNRGWDRGWVKHEVNLRLPRNISMNVSGINGSVNVAHITGEIAVSGVNGRVEIAQAGTATELSGINGRTLVSVERIGQGGLRVSGINGGVEINLPESTNADVDVRSINGGIDTDLPINVIGEMRRGQLTGKIGSGGARISVSGVNGGVALRRN